MLRIIPIFKFSLSLIVCTMFLLAAGCGETNVPQNAGPIEGKRLDGVVVTDASPTDTKTKDNAATTETKTQPEITPGTTNDSNPLPKLTPETEDEKKKREEWRNKKTGKPDENNPIDQANVTLRPSLANPDAKTKTDPSATKLPDDPTALAKPLIDPTAPVPYADPNNPDFIPADRTRSKTFAIDKLKAIDDHLIVPFMDLSGFPYTGMTGAPEPTKDSKEPAKPEYVIPDNIKALDGKKVSITGYMMPIDFENGGTNEFVLTRQIPSCFYCVPPQLNDWVEVKMKDGKRVDYIPDGIVEIHGIIEVGEIKEDGFVVAMYRMTGTKMIASKQE